MGPSAVRAPARPPPTDATLTVPSPLAGDGTTTTERVPDLQALPHAACRGELEDTTAIAALLADLRKKWEVEPAAVPRQLQEYSELPPGGQGFTERRARLFELLREAQHLAGGASGLTTIIIELIVRAVDKHDRGREANNLLDANFLVRLVDHVVLRPLVERVVNAARKAPANHFVFAAAGSGVTVAAMNALRFAMFGLCPGGYLRVQGGKRNLIAGNSEFATMWPPFTPHSLALSP